MDRATRLVGIALAGFLAMPAYLIVSDSSGRPLAEEFQIDFEVQSINEPKRSWRITPEGVRWRQEVFAARGLSEQTRGTHPLPPGSADAIQKLLISQDICSENFTIGERGPMIGSEYSYSLRVRSGECDRSYIFFDKTPDELVPLMRAINGVVAAGN